MIAMTRRDKENYYLDIAEAVASRGTCLRRNFGAIIVKNDQIVAKNCSDLGYCLREKMNVPRGQRYELCRSVHAEANAIISAARSEMIGSTLYLVGKDAKTGALVPDANSCSMCKRQIINAGISRVIIRNTHDTFTTVFVVEDWVLNDASLQGESGY